MSLMQIYIIIIIILSRYENQQYFENKSILKMYNTLYLRDFIHRHFEIGFCLF